MGPLGLRKRGVGGQAAAPHHYQFTPESYTVIFSSGNPSIRYSQVRAYDAK